MAEISLEEIDRIFPERRARALYRNAIERQWSAQHAIDWDDLSFRMLTPPIREAMSAVYGDILYAEAFAVEVAAKMVDLAPEGWLREFARSQAGDETRHADFFARAVHKLSPHDDSPELVMLRSEFSRTRDYDALVMHGQVVETAARVLFVANGNRALEMMRRGVRLPGSDAIATFVRAVAELVGRDESRHIAFGQHYLSKCLAECDARRRHELEDWARSSAQLMYAAFARRSRDFQRLGVSPVEVLERTWSALRVQLGRLDFDIGGPPSLVD